MPISDTDPYLAGHFDRVFTHLIEPACTAAGFTAVLASRVQNTHFIVIDIIKRLLSADMAVCDLSGRNPNVLYELGIRQAFNKPVTLLKDSRTPRIFDIQGLRDVEYDDSLRVDSIKKSLDELSTTMRNTYDASNRQSGDINSLVQLLGITAATVPVPKQLTDETNLVLASLRTIGDRLTNLEDIAQRGALLPQQNLLSFTPAGAAIRYPESSLLGISGTVINVPGVQGTGYVSAVPSILSTPSTGPQGPTGPIVLDKSTGTRPPKKTQ